MSYRHAYLGFVLVTLVGCAHHWLPTLHEPIGDAGMSPAMEFNNPMFVPVQDHEFVWNQVVDTIDDYFQIEREERVRIVGEVITEGRIETIPRTGATLLEPWRRDSTRGYEKLHATLQSVRRYASVRVMPVAAGYSIEVAVFKELEDVQRPEHSTAGEATLRHDGSLVRNEIKPGETATSLGWIPLGRDISLEQEILSHLHGRLAASSSAGPRLLGRHH